MSKPSNPEIPFEVDENELLLRGIFHPQFYSNSKQKVKREAFLPPSNRKDVSLLRYRYTNENFCKNHFAKLKLGESKYCGVATFHKFQTGNIYLEIEDSIRILVEVKGTPIDSNNNYVEKPPVYTNSLGLPMHSDMLYETPFIKGEPNTKHRIFADKLAKIVNYFPDNDIESSVWEGERFS